MRTNALPRRLAPSPYEMPPSSGRAGSHTCPPGVSQVLQGKWEGCIDGDRWANKRPRGVLGATGEDFPDSVRLMQPAVPLWGDGRRAAPTPAAGHRAGIPWAAPPLGDCVPGIPARGLPIRGATAAPVPAQARAPTLLESRATVITGTSSGLFHRATCCHHGHTLRAGGCCTWHPAVITRGAAPQLL